MGFRATLALLLVAGLLVGLLVFTEEGPAGPVDVTEPVLGGRRVSDTARIVIERDRAGETLVLESRPDGSVWMIEPVRDLASAAALRSIAVSYDGAQRLEAYTTEELAAEPELLAETGLEAPRARVRFEFPDGAPVVLELGAEAPLGTDIFARMDDTIYRVGLDLLSVVEVNPEDLRERQVFRHYPPEVEEIVVERLLDSGGRETLRLVRDGREFRMVEPLEGRVDLANLPVFMDSVLGLRAEAFVPGVMRPPPREPDMVITVRGTGEERVPIWFEDERTLLGTIESRGVSFKTVATEARQFFATAVENLRAHLLVPLDALEIASIALDPGGDAPAAVLRRTGEGFRMSRPVDAVANPTAVNSVMQGLRNLGVEEFVDGSSDDPTFGLDAGFFTVTVLGQLDPAPIHVRLGRDEGSLTYARRDGEDHVVKVPRAAAEILRQPWTAFVALQVQRVAVPVGELRVVRPGGLETGYHRGDDGRWRRRGENQPLPLVEDLVGELQDLRAVRALDPRTTELDVEPFRVQLFRTSGDRLTDLRVYDRGDGPLLARPERPDVLFELSARDSRDIRDLR